MFYYFAYGSNLSVVSLRAKGVEPLSSEPATLEGWRLAFTIPDFFSLEGGTGNIELSEGSAVHGVLHGCRAAHLPLLDQAEAVGIVYERVEASVTTYSGRQARAYVYVGLASVRDDGNRPSERYRNILVRGASEMRLEPHYVEWLRNLPTCVRPKCGLFEPPFVGEKFTLATLAQRPSHVAIYGHVFDMSHARARHTYLRGLLGGKDVTLFFLKRMDSSDGSEHFDDVVTGQLREEQRDHLNAYVREFAREYEYAGTIRYGVTPSSDVPPYASSSRMVAAPVARRSSSAPNWVPTHAIAASFSDGSPTPARKVLLRSEEAFETLGHENLGFLSESHGFMPRLRPQLELPDSYAAWDALAAGLPALHRDLRVRKALASMPVLPADEGSLSDEHLLRAACLLAMFSHAYWYAETQPPVALPEALAEPWRQVRERLGRGPAVLTYQDLIVYNWRMVDPTRADPMRIDNLRLLVPTVDNDEERTFYLTQTEILSHLSPAVGAVVRAQEAVVRDDREALESELLTVINCLQRVLHESLLKINPNPHATPHVDPVVWAKTVAPFAVPMEKSVQGPSGTSSPVFNMLDVFFGRTKYETFLGREIYALRGTYPPFWREFLAALQEISVPSYVAQRGDEHLTGLLQEAVDSYAGPNGFFGRHRMKVYGYLELAFKVGRSVTIGGFQGVFKNRTWDMVDAELERARHERAQSFPSTCHHVRVKRVDNKGDVAEVVLDVEGAGIRYEAGDRSGVLPENSDALIQRTVSALRASGDERVALTREWREAVRLRYGYQNASELSVREVLRFGKIRPVIPRVAEALHALTQDAQIAEVLRRKKTQQWELWELLKLINQSSANVATLWRVDCGAPHDALCRLVPPEDFRMYSISSVMSSAETRSAKELTLTVGRLRYAAPASEADEAPPSRRGTASNFLANAAGRDEPISLVVQHPPRFGLPRDPRTPLVMFAGGTGLSPFRGFLVERQRQLAAGEAWLFLGIRSREQLTAYEPELAASCASGQLRLKVAFSREAIDVAYEGGVFVYGPGEKRRAPELIADKKTSEELLTLLRPKSEGGKGATVYVCGGSRFARSVTEALTGVFRQACNGTAAERETFARQSLRDLIAEDRFLQEIFSGEAVDDDVPEVNVSELSRHNNDENGYWIAIAGRVYDVSEFVHLHPGGAKVLRGYAGMDATDGYAKAHDGRSEIDAMREMYAVGAIRPLALEGPTALVKGPAGPQAVSLAAVHRAWVQQLYLLCEMQNALANDHSLQHCKTTRVDPPEGRTLYKLQRGIETHERFLRAYLDGLCTQSVPNLWAITQGFFDEGGDLGWAHSQLESARASEEGRFTEALPASLLKALRRIAKEGEEGESAGDKSRQALARVEQACMALERHDSRLLADIKALLVEGVELFEHLEAKLPSEASGRLIAACRELPDRVSEYFERVEKELRDELGFRPPVDGVMTVPPAALKEHMKTLVLSNHWSMEEDAHARVVILRRTPVPFLSLERVVGENDRVMREIRPDHGTYGVVVDMRQAPPRNDPAFEDSMRTLRETLSARFARVAVLLTSAVGVLQVNRIGRNEGSKTYATLSEESAVRFARGHSDGLGRTAVRGLRGKTHCAISVS